VKYANIVLLVLSCLFGGYLGHKFFPRTVVQPVPTVVTKTQTVTKEIVRQADGTVIERVVTQTKDRVKASPQPKKEYRVGALLPVASELRLPTVTASRRLFGDIWATAQYDSRHKEITLGIDYEF
jgi:hypothetical protein